MKHCEGNLLVGLDRCGKLLVMVIMVREVVVRMRSSNV